MRTLRRLIACALGIASPTRVWASPDYGPAPSWLDRWEMRIDAEARARVIEGTAALFTVRQARRRRRAAMGLPPVRARHRG